jgi:threonine aldolase
MAPLLPTVQSLGTRYAESAAYFSALLADGKWKELGNQANAQALVLSSDLQAQGYPVLSPVRTYRVSIEANEPLILALSGISGVSTKGSLHLR